MRIHRSSMEKILDQQERDTLITNPKQPIRTFIRKVRYLFAAKKERIKNKVKE